MLIGLLALIAAALFAGAALYISLAEHPARLGLEDRPALAQWKSSYARAVPMQAGLALVSLGLGLWAWQRTDEPWVLAAALLIGANLPLTLIAIMPTNKKLGGTAPEAAGAESRALLARWGRMHALRTLLALAAVAAYFVAFLWP